MANKCSDYNVKGCPASYYLKCSAYAEGMNCWEVTRVPCCAKSMLSECRDCEVYRRGKSQQEQETSDSSLLPERESPGNPAIRGPKPKDSKDFARFLG